MASKPKAVMKTKASGTLQGLNSMQLSKLFSTYRNQIAKAIPRHLTPERMIAQATTLVSTTPEIAECSAASIIGSVLQASILGFQPVAALGQCYLVPFNNRKSGKREAQFLIGYKGYIDLARRSGNIKTIYAQAVYTNDRFEYEFGLTPSVKHVPTQDADRGALTHTYAVAHFTNGGYSFEVMTKAEIDAVRRTSAAGKSAYSPWNNFYDEMAKKTVVRRLSKYLPLSVDSQQAIAADEVVITPDVITGGELDLDEAVENTEEETSVTTMTIDVDTGEIIEPTVKDEELFPDDFNMKDSK